MICQTYRNRWFKVLSSEMDPAESRFIKRHGGFFLYKNPPFCESLKILRHLIQLLAIRILIPDAAMKTHRSI
jgi:hypothetical protein